MRGGGRGRGGEGRGGEGEGRGGEERGGEGRGEERRVIVLSYTVLGAKKNGARLQTCSSDSPRSRSKERGGR